MASATDTCADLIRRFPSRYANRTQALHHLLRVAGNGYEWIDGELVDPTGDRRAQEDVDGDVLRVLADAYGHDSLIATVSRAAITAEHRRHLWRRAAADELARTPGPLEGEPYPHAEASALSRMDDDATQDWIDAAAEITAALSAPLPTVPEGPRP